MAITITFRIENATYKPVTRRKGNQLVFTYTSVGQESGIPLSLLNLLFHTNYTRNSLKINTNILIRLETSLIKKKEKNCSTR